jgi:hypothetical protein
VVRGNIIFHSSQEREELGGLKVVKDKEILALYNSGSSSAYDNKEVG